MMKNEPVYRNCPKCAAVMDGKRVCPVCGYKLRGPKPGQKGKIITAVPAGPEPPTPQPQETDSPRKPSILTTVTIIVCVDCGNPASLEAFRALLKELSK